MTSLSRQMGLLRPLIACIVKVGNFIWPPNALYNHWARGKANPAL